MAGRDMTSDRIDTHRRTVLASLAAAGVGLAGCSSLPFRDDDDTDSPTPGTADGTTTPENGDGTPGNKPSPDDVGTHEPMEAAAARFEDLSYWTAHAGVEVQGDSNEVYEGSQSARIEGRSGTIERGFQVPIDLSNLDVSLAMKVDGPVPTNLRMIFTDTGGNQTQLIQGLHGRHPSGWIRINPSINTADADMSGIERMIITLDGGGENKKYWVDDIRFHDKAGNKGQVMFSFDFATRSIYETAYPIMKQRGIVGCAAVPTDNVGNADRLTWDELKEMQDDGWELASMTNAWDALFGQDKNLQRQRMERALDQFEDNGLEKPPALMYPRGFCDDSTVELARELHDIAFIRFPETERGLSQSAIMGPQFVNRSRPNTPDAVANQMQPVSNYKGLYTIVHNEIGPNAENSESEFRQMVDHVKDAVDQGQVEIVTPSDVVLK